MPGTKNFLCVSCPVGCALSVAVDGGDVTRVDGNSCPLGEKYARSEVKNPVRIFTSTVKVSGGVLPVCPVRSDAPLPLRRISEAAREVADVTVNAPIEIGQVIVKNICGTGANIIASRTLHSISIASPKEKNL